MRIVGFVICIMACAFQGLSAQKIEVKDFGETSEIQMVSTQRKDANGGICALIRVAIPSNEAVLFQGNVIGEAKYKGNEYMIYMSAGSRFLRIHYANSQTLGIDFTQYGYEGLASKRVYELVLSLPERQPLLLPVVGGRESPGRREDKLKLYTYSEENWSEGRLAVRLKGCGSNCKYGFIDSDANLVIPCLFDTIANFSEGLCLVRMGEKYGFVDSLGNIVIEPQYDFATSFKNGKAAVFAKENKYESMIIDKQGNVIGDFRFRPELLGLTDLYKYAVLKRSEEDHEKAFIALKAYENRKKTKGDIYWLPNNIKTTKEEQEIIYMLGDYYYYNHGLDSIIQQDKSIAFMYWYSIASYNGDAECRLAMCYLYGYGCTKNTNQAIKHFEHAVELSSPMAMSQLGERYYRGYYIPQDTLKGKALIVQSANLGYTAALYQLGEIYEGKWIAGDSNLNYHEAFYYYKLAAQQDYLPALDKLARCYSEGIGVERDLNMAVDLWFKYSRKSPLFELSTLEEISNLYASGLITSYNEDVIMRLEEIVKQCLTTVDGKGSYLNRIRFNLAICYYYGYGVEQDLTKSIKYLSKVAYTGFDTYINDLALANLILSWCYFKGYGVKKDLIVAKQCQFETWQTVEYYFFKNDIIPNKSNYYNTFTDYCKYSLGDYFGTEFERDVNIMMRLKSEGFFIIHSKRKERENYWINKDSSNRKVCLRRILEI